MLAVAEENASILGAVRTTSPYLSCRSLTAYDILPVMVAIVLGIRDAAKLFGPGNFDRG